MIVDLTQSTTNEGVVPDDGSIWLTCPPVESRFYGKVVIEADGLHYKVFSNCDPSGGKTKTIHVTIPSDFVGKHFTAKLEIWNDYVAPV